jgi:hypothetical protein
VSAGSSGMSFGFLALITLTAAAAVIIAFFVGVRTAQRSSTQIKRNGGLVLPALEGKTLRINCTYGSVSTNEHDALSPNPTCGKRDPKTRNETVYS